MPLFCNALTLRLRDEQTSGDVGVVVVSVVRQRVRMLLEGGGGERCFVCAPLADFAVLATAAVRQQMNSAQHSTVQRASNERTNERTSARRASERTNEQASDRPTALSEGMRESRHVSNDDDGDSHTLRWYYVIALLARVALLCCVISVRSLMCKTDAIALLLSLLLLLLLPLLL